MRQFFLPLVPVRAMAPMAGASVSYSPMVALELAVSLTTPSVTWTFTRARLVPR